MSSDFKVFTCDRFTGHYPVGVAAVVVAQNAKVAAGILSEALGREGLSQLIPAHHMMEVPLHTNYVNVINAGNY